ncbi:unnamed protein product [Caenorhabditis brenneri]
MEALENYPLLIDHLIQSEIPGDFLLEGKVITCARYDQKYAENAEIRLEEEFPEHIIGCKSLEKEKKVVTVTSRNTLTIRESSKLKIEKKLQCDYFATSICSLIIGESLESCHVFFGSVIGDLIDWMPNKEEKPMMRKGHKGMIFSIVTDSTRIFTISDDRTIRMWSIEERESGPICTVFGHTARPLAISVDPAHNSIYTGGIEQTLFCWKYDDSSINLTQKMPLSIGVIRKISQLDKSTLAITSQNGDLLKIHVDKRKEDQETILKENVVNFAHLKEKLVILTSKNELLLYESSQMDRIIFRCGGMKHMTSSEESVVSWQHNMLVVIQSNSVHRIKVSMNIISVVCYTGFVVIKSIDGIITIYDFSDTAKIRCLKRFRPKNPSLMPVVFTICDEILIMGTTHGELYHTDLKDGECVLSLSRRDSFEIFGGKEVTCIRPIPKTSTFMTLGKTGIWSTMRYKNGKMEVLNSRSFAASSRMAWPSKFIEWNNGKELLIVGFYGTSLIIWNSTTGLPMFETYCGGGHRIWKLNPSNDSIFHFDFIKDSELCRQKIDLKSKEYLISTAHSSSIVAASGSRSYLITVSLDGHLSIGDNRVKAIITMFVGENLLCTDVFEDPKNSENSEVYILAGGGKSKLGIIRFNSNDLQDHGIFWMRHVARPDEGRIVAVKTCQATHDLKFFIASYSSGVVEVFRIIEDSVESMSLLEIEDSMGIASRMDFLEGKLIVGTSGSYVLSYELTQDGKLEEKMRMKLEDRSGVTSLSIYSDEISYFGCDSGHVYRCSSNKITKIHSHLSTVVGIVPEKRSIHSVSLDCAILTSSDSTSSVSRKPTIIDMPNGMVKTGKSSLVVVGDGIQLIDNL